MTLEPCDEDRSIFENMIAVVLQIIFYAKIYVNDVFLFLKNYF